MDAAAQRRIEAQATFDAMASIVSSVQATLNAVALKTWLLQPLLMLSVRLIVEGR